MAWTQTDITALEKAIGAGVLEVQYSDGRRVRYHSLDEMLRLRDVMRKEVAVAAGTTRIRQVRLYGSKGL